MPGSNSKEGEPVTSGKQDNGPESNLNQVESPSSNDRNSDR